MKLPNAPAQYDYRNESNMRLQLEQEDGKSFKQGKDIILVRERIVLVSPDGTYWALAAADDGTLSLTSYP